MSKKWDETHREERKQLNRKFKDKNPNYYKKYMRDYRLRKKKEMIEQAIKNNMELLFNEHQG